MTSWDGQGLPPVAQRRVERFADSHLRTSLLSVPAAVSLENAGFDTVGEVMGTMVQRISWTGWAGCGMWTGGLGGGGMGYGYNQGRATTVQSSSSSRFAGYAPYVHAVTNGYDTAMNRMLLEARALGADGVVGVSLRQTHMDNSAREFMALGTAVRARSRHRPSHLFTTDLSGTDVAKLMMSGWVPVALQIGLEVAIRHDDWQTRMQAGTPWSNRQNVEVTGYTDLVQHTRGLARDKLAHKIAVAGADGGILSAMTLRIWEIEPSENHRDHAAEAMITGTALARFQHHGRPATAPLTIIPTRTGRQRSATRAGRR